MQGSYLHYDIGIPGSHAPMKYEQIQVFSEGKLLRCMLVLNMRNISDLHSMGFCNFVIINCNNDYSSITTIRLSSADM
jgi:hypothetical protein